MAACGVVDFSSIDDDDPSWMVRLTLLSRAHVNKRLAEVFRVQYQHAFHIALNGDEKAWEESMDALQRYIDASLPWQKAGRKYREKALESVAEKMTKTWEAIYGPMDSPETQMRIDATVKMIERGVQENL